MKKFSATVLMVFVGAMACGQEKQILTLRAACKEAERKNRSITAARLNRYAGLERERQAASNYWPRLTFSALSSRTNRSDAAFGQLLNQGESVLTLIDLPHVDNYRTQAEMRYLLFDGGERRHRVRALGHEYEALRCSEELVRAEVLTAVVETFYSVLCAGYETEIAKKELERMRERLEFAKKLMVQGKATQVEVSAAQYHLNKAGKDLVAARNASLNAGEWLGHLLGRGTIVTGEFEEGKDGPLEGVPKVVTPEEAEEMAVQESPKVARARRIAAAGREAAKATRSRWIPQITLSANYGFDCEDPGEFDSDQNSYLLAVLLSWDAFDGGMRTARIREARNLSIAAGVRSRDERGRVSLAARRAARERIEADRAYSVAQKKVASYTLEYEQKQKGYESGRVSFLDLLDAQSDLAASRLEEARAYCETKSSQARLLRTLGFWKDWK